MCCLDINSIHASYKLIALVVFTLKEAHLLKMATWSPPQCAVVSAPLLSSSPTAVQDDKVSYNYV